MKKIVFDEIVLLLIQFFFLHVVASLLAGGKARARQLGFFFAREKNENIIFWDFFISKENVTKNEKIKNFFKHYHIIIFGNL